MVIMEKVLQAAQPYLQGRTVRDIVVGVSLIGAELDNGSVGVSYLLREDLPKGCGAFPYVLRELLGTDAGKAARLVLEGEDLLARAVGSAVLAAASGAQDLPDDISENGMPFNLEIRPNDKIGMIGLIAPVARQIYAMNPNLVIFDAHIPSADGLPPVQPQAAQPLLLPECDIVILSGTTTINGSIDGLLRICPRAREIVMVGQSTPMFAEGWRGSGLTRLAGSLWRNECKEQIFHDIARACGTMQLAPYMLKKRVDL